MIALAAVVLGGAMAVMLTRLFSGPTLYDRVLAVNSFGTKTVLFLCVFAFIIGRSDAIDIAMLYALVNFVATIAILKFFRYGTFEPSLAELAAQDDEHPNRPGPAAGSRGGER